MHGVEDMDMNMKNSMFVYFLISYFVIYKASWLLKGMQIIPGHSKHSASSVPKYNWYSCNHIIFTDGQDASSSRGDCWEVHLGPVWSSSHAPLIPIWGDGEPLPHLCLTHSACELHIAMLLWFQIGHAATLRSWTDFYHPLPSQAGDRSLANVSTPATCMLVSLSAYYQWWLVVGGCLGAFTFSELSSTHVFTYNGQSMNNAISKLAQLSIPKPVHLSAVCPSFNHVILLHIWVMVVASIDIQDTVRVLHKHEVMQGLRYNILHTWSMVPVTWCMLEVHVPTHVSACIV